jgi:ADP-ribose pyrophosphatase YjhB (NUDIX family)
MTVPIPDHIRRLREKIGHQLIQASAAGTFVFDTDRRVLLVRHHMGVWTNPGGMIEPAETPADAAVRETWEETGLLVELTRLIGVFGGPDHRVVYPNGDEIEYLSIAFEARAVGGSLRPDGVETLEARYVTAAEAETLPLSRHVRPRLRAAFGGAAHPGFEPARWRPPAPA